MPRQLGGSVAQSGNIAAADARPQILAPAPKLAEASGQRQRFFTRSSAVVGSASDYSADHQQHGCMRESVALVRTLLSYPMFIILSTTAN